MPVSCVIDAPPLDARGFEEEVVQGVSPASQLNKCVRALFEHDSRVWMCDPRSRQRLAEYQGQGTLGGWALTQILEVHVQVAGQRVEVQPAVARHDLRQFLVRTLVRVVGLLGNGACQRR
jgi:hypothetical protein